MSSPDSAVCTPFDPHLFARLSRLVAAGEPIDAVLLRILEEAVTATNSIRGFLALVDHDRGELDVRYVAGVGWSEDKRLGRLRVSEETGRGITSHVAATAQPYRSPNVLEDSYYLPSFDDVRSELAVPLVDSSRRTRGVINVESVQLDGYDDSHMFTLQSLADLAMIAITIDDHQSRGIALFQVGRELSGFSEADTIMQKVIDLAGDALKFEDCSLFLIDEHTGKLVLRASRGSLRNKVAEASYDIGDGLTGWTAQTGETIRVTDPSSDPRWRGRFEEMPAKVTGAFMAVPVKSHRGVLGVLRVQRKKSPYKWFPNAFTEEEESVLATIAAQLGIALDNARLIQQLVNTERMAAWGELSARSAHMIGNRVFAIKGDINELEYHLQRHSIDCDAALRLSESIKNGIYLLEEILNEFREFVKAGRLELETADLNTLVTESVEEGFPKQSTSQVQMQLSPSLHPISADPKKLKRCFTELLENSVNFMPNGGQIVVSTARADSRAKKILPPRYRNRPYVIIRFEDNGPGIKREDKPKIFDPFYTSRAKGMGLGLSIVKSIIEGHRGVIVEDGRPGKGARFTILLPAAEQTKD
jgi:signal transduction histidine kinase